MKLTLAGMSRGETPVLGPIELVLGPAETVALLGPSGIGKTTLLRIVAGLEDAANARVEGAGRVAMVFQEPVLLPWRTVLDNIALPSGCTPVQAGALVALVGLEGREGAYPRALSLGQQRRVALARAFAARPQTLLLDEPFVSLDAEASGQMQGLLARLIEEYPVRTLLVTHDPGEALRLADRVVRLGGAPARIVGETRLRRARGARDAAWMATARTALAAGAATA